MTGAIREVNNGTAQEGSQRRVGLTAERMNLQQESRESWQNNGGNMATEVMSNHSKPRRFSRARRRLEKLIQGNKAERKRSKATNEPDNTVILLSEEHTNTKRTTVMEATEEHESTGGRNSSVDIRNQHEHQPTPKRVDIYI